MKNQCKDPKQFPQPAIMDESVLPNLLPLLNEVNRLLTAHQILEKIWTDLGPYEQGKITPETMRAMHNYFDFDDSE